MPNGRDTTGHLWLDAKHESPTFAQQMERYGGRVVKMNKSN